MTTKESILANLNKPSMNIPSAKATETKAKLAPKSRGKLATGTRGILKESVGEKEEIPEEVEETKKVEFTEPLTKKGSKEEISKVEMEEKVEVKERLGSPIREDFKSRKQLKDLDIEVISEAKSVKDLAEENIDNDLLSRGYIPIMKVLLDKDKDLPQRIKYMKAYNPNGEIVYILLDDPGLCEGNLCVNVSEESVGPEIPLTLKIKATDCLNLDICGVAFECESDICTLHRSEENPSVYDEKSFKKLKLTKTDPEFLQVDGMKIPYPIVRISEIRSNPEAALAATTNAFRVIRNKFFNLAKDDSEKTAEKYKQLSVESSGIQDKIKAINLGLQDDFIKLRTFIDKRRKMGRVEGTQKKLYEDTMDNIRKRNLYFEDYLSAIDRYNRTSNEVNKLLKDLTAINLKLQKVKSILGIDLTKV